MTTTTNPLSKLLGPWVREIDRATLRADALGGLLGAVLVLPQAIAFAALVGLPPSYGLATAVLPCIVAALFGSSRHVMSGPTNANSLAMVAMVAPLAAVAHFISPAALRGFTGGAALLIAVHALKDALGVVVPSGLSAPAALSLL